MYNVYKQTETYRLFINKIHEEFYNGTLIQLTTLKLNQTSTIIIPLLQIFQTQEEFTIPNPTMIIS